MDLITLTFCRLRNRDVGAVLAITCINTSLIKLEFGDSISRCMVVNERLSRQRPFESFSQKVSIWEERGM